MKTERRHELQSNELVQLLTQYYARLKPYFGWILTGVALVALLWFAFGWLGFTRGRQLRAGWSEFVQASKARDVDGLRQVAARFPRTPAAARALYVAGSLGLHAGATRLVFDRAEGLEILDQARKDLEAALAVPVQDAFLSSQTLLALAQVHEATNELEKAKEQYRRIVSSYPGSSSALTAQQRLDFIGTADAVAFSDWFTEQRIESPTATSTSGLSPQGPSLHDDLPISRDLMLPSADALERSLIDSELGPMVPPETGENSTEGGPITDETPVPGEPAANESPTSEPTAVDGGVKAKGDTEQAKEEPGSQPNNDDATPE